MCWMKAALASAPRSWKSFSHSASQQAQFLDPAQVQVAQFGSLTELQTAT
jgi:hypothetical protein